MIAITAQHIAEMSHAHDVAEDYVPFARRHTPTPAQIAVRDELASVGRLDERDATSTIMSYLALVDQRIAAGVSAEQIAIDLTLTRIIGLSLEESEFIQKRAKANGITPRQAAFDFYYHTDYPVLRADMDAARAR